MLSALILLCLATEPSNTSTPPTYATEISTAVADAAPIYRVPPPLVKAVIRAESACDPLATSRAGAVGLMQVMPKNAQNLGTTTKDLTDPLSNVVAGTRLLAALLQHYRGDLLATLIAYNAGPRRRGDPLPRNHETPRYVFEVLHAYRWFSKHEAAGPCSPLK